jgi:hypothetical protein
MGARVRHQGVRWQVLFGRYDGVQQFAVDELQRMVQYFLPYVLAVAPANEQSDLSAHRPRAHAQTPHESNLILVGTAKDNGAIACLIARGKIRVPAEPGGYCIASLKSPWNPESSGQKLLVVAGHDDEGVLYGVEDLCARALSRHASHNWQPPRIMPENPSLLRKAFDDMPEFSIADYPRIASRGLWTWGYVIYDYKRFLDNMARLRMNTLIVWNDAPPINSPQIIAYAHSRGIKIIYGFHWGWDALFDTATGAVVLGGTAVPSATPGTLKNIEMDNPLHRRQIKDLVVAQYRKDYQHLDLDGIYFQTLTEHSNTKLGGRSVAAVATDWANDIAGGLFKIKKDLYIQFGLHATSIKDDYKDLKRLDKRISIVWEDAGALPWSYEPHADFRHGGSTASSPPSGMCKPADLNTPMNVLDYSKKLVNFRPGSEFAMVPKGWICLRWGEDFEHHGPFIMGERHPRYIRDRLAQRQPRWDMVNALWLQHYPVAAKFYREILDKRPPRMLVAGLVEDGMFEQAIQPSVALFAQTLWNPYQPDNEILDLALSPYYGNML